MNGNLLVEYIVRCAPGVCIGCSMLVMIPKNLHMLRMMIYIMMFVLTRDVMTPLGLWKLESYPVILFEFIHDPAILIFLAIASLIIVFLMNFIEIELNSLVVWRKGNDGPLVFVGLCGSLIVFLPVILIKQLFGNSNSTIASTSTSSPFYLFSIFLLSMCGNLYEEVLFRGFFQGYLEKSLPKLQAAVASGFFFGFCHSFLASSVTNNGLSLLIFVVYEGIIAAIVRMNYGVLASALTHGMAIFLMCVTS